LGTQAKFDSREINAWSQYINTGAAHAVSRLSKMIEREVRLTCLNMKAMSPDYAANMLGGPENPVVAIYLTIKGDCHGHILLAYPPDIAYGLVDMILGQPPNTTQELGEMESSVLEEIGNIVGTAFLNSVGDDTGARLQPSPPVLMTDMAGAVLSIALSDILQEHDEIYAMEAVFDTSDKQVAGVLLIMPSAGFLEAVRAHAAERHNSL
jgi:chemotaxis protein CheC